jgi:nitrate reductase NapE component
MRVANDNAPPAMVLRVVAWIGALFVSIGIWGALIAAFVGGL